MTRHRHDVARHEPARRNRDLRGRPQCWASTATARPPVPRMLPVGACGDHRERRAGLAETLCVQAFPMEPSPSRESYARWRMLERDPSRHRRRASSHPPTSRAAPRCYSSCGRRTPPVKMCATCFTTSASSSSPKMASRFYHPPDASSIHGDAFFPEGWARASAATP